MSNEIVVPEEISSEIANLDHLNTPEKRFTHLSRSFTEAIIVIAKMQEERDWENLTKEDGTPYKSLTDMVHDALKISDSYARRLVQTATSFYTPLEAITVEGTVISITSGEAAKLGNSGMKEVVAQVEEEVKEESDPEKQSSIIDAVKNDVLQSKSKPSFDDFDDDFDDEDIDDLDFDDADEPFDDDNDAPAASSKKSKSSPSSEDFDDSDFETDDLPEAPQPKAKKEKGKQKSSDLLGPIEKIMGGGKEYKTEEDIATLPEELQEFVRALIYLSELDAVELSGLITEERRGVTYPIRKAHSNLTLVLSSTETSNWVLEQI